MEEELRHYLGRLGRLYEEGMMYDVHPDLLRRMGGALALAGRDAGWVRVEEDAVLGVIDRRRAPADIQRIARRRWREHRGQIEAAIARGVPPARAIEQYFRSRTGRFPHSPAQLEQMLRLVTGSLGTYSAWFDDVARFRARFRRGGQVLTGSTFTSIAAAAYLFATAENWQAGTPEEWDRALSFGEAVAPIAGMADAASGVRSGRMRTPPSATGARPRAAVVAPASPRGTAARATGSAARGTAARGTAGRGTGGTSRASGSGGPPPDDLNVDAALSPGAPFRRGRMRGIDRQGRRLEDRGRRSGPGQDDLDFASARQRRRPTRTIAALSSLNLDPTQVRAARRILGRRLDGRWLRHWQRANNARARRDMQRVRQLERQGDLSAARALARQVYDNYRGRFWNSVRSDARLVHRLRQAGITVPESGVPYYRMGSRREHVTLEHSGRVHDQPSRAVQGNQLLFVLRRENSGMLEGLREAAE